MHLKTVKVVNFKFCVFYHNLKNVKKKKKLPNPKKMYKVGIVIEARRFSESLPLDYSVNLRIGLDDKSFCCKAWVAASLGIR